MVLLSVVACRSEGSTTKRTARGLRSRRWSPGTVRNLAPACGDCHCDDLVGDVGLIAFGVSLLQLHHIGDHPTILAVRKLIDLGPTRTWHASPAIGTGILSGRVPHITFLRIEYFRQLDTRTAAKLVSQRRGFCRYLLIFTDSKDEGVIAITSGRARSSREGGRAACRRCCRIFATAIDRQAAIRRNSGPCKERIRATIRVRYCPATEPSDHEPGSAPIKSPK
jgi:hypothetical protein